MNCSLGDSWTSANFGHWQLLGEFDATTKLLNPGRLEDASTLQDGSPHPSRITRFYRRITRYYPMIIFADAAGKTYLKITPKACMIPNHGRRKLLIIVNVNAAMRVQCSGRRYWDNHNGIPSRTFTETGSPLSSAGRNTHLLNVSNKGFFN